MRSNNSRTSRPRSKSGTDHQEDDRIIEKLFQGKRAVVTGGGAGIGRACALAPAAEGRFVTVAGRTEDTLHDTVRLAVEASGSAPAVRCDVTRTDGAVSSRRRRQRRRSTRNLILPEPAEFLDKNLPDCSMVRPTLDRNGGAVAASDCFIADRRFEGPSPRFFTSVRQLAREADAAERRIH